jgi:hypothetical protein
MNGNSSITLAFLTYGIAFLISMGTAALISLMVKTLEWRNRRAHKKDS